jgi:hypothetical protein
VKILAGSLVRGPAARVLRLTVVQNRVASADREVDVLLTFAGQPSSSSAAIPVGCSTLRPNSGRRDLAGCLREKVSWW